MLSTTVNLSRSELKRVSMLQDFTTTKNQLPSIILETTSDASKIDVIPIDSIEQQIAQGGTLIGIILSLTSLIFALSALVKASQD